MSNPDQVAPVELKLNMQVVAQYRRHLLVVQLGALAPGQMEGEEPAVIVDLQSGEVSEPKKLGGIPAWIPVTTEITASPEDQRRAAELARQAWTPKARKAWTAMTGSTTS